MTIQWPDDDPQNLLFGRETVLDSGTRDDTASNCVSKSIKRSPASPASLITRLWDDEETRAGVTNCVVLLVSCSPRPRHQPLDAMPFPPESKFMSLSLHDEESLQRNPAVSRRHPLPVLCLMEKWTHSRASSTAKHVFCMQAIVMREMVVNIVSESVRSLRSVMLPNLGLR